MPDANELVIRMKLDRSLAEAEADAFHKAEKARIAKTLTDAEVAEKARTAYIRRENSQRVQEAARARKTAIEQAREVAEAEKKLAREVADERRRRAKDAADAKRKADKEAADDARQWTRRELTEAEVAERAKVEALRRSNRQRVHEAADAHGRQKGLIVDLKAAETSMLEALGERWRSKIGLTGEAGLAVAGVGVAMLGLRAGETVLAALSDRWKGMSAVAMEAAKAAERYGRAQLELAGFADTPGQTVEQQQRTAELVAASGISMDQATDLRRAAEAGAYAILDKPGKEGLMSRGEFEKAQKAAAKWAAVSGGEAADYGKAVAMIPSLEGRRMTADEVEGDLVRMDKLATIAGFESPSDLVKQVQGVSGYIKSGVVGSKIAQGLTAIAAKTSPGEAGTIVEQMMTALSAGALMDRGVSIPDEFKDQAMTSAGWFKDIGVRPNMKPEAALPLIDEALAKLPEGTNKDQYLLQHGVTNQKSRQGFLMFHGERQTWDKEVMPILNANIPAGTVETTWRDHIEGDPVGRGRIAEASSDLAANVAGRRTQGIATLMAQEYALLKARGEAAGDLGEYTAEDGWLDVGRKLKGTTTGALMKPVASRIVAEMNRLNLSTDLGYDSDGTRSDVYSELTGWGSQQYKAGIIDRVTAQVRGAGGDATFGGRDILDQLTRDSAADRRVLERIEENTRPQASGGRPRQPPARP